MIQKKYTLKRFSSDLPQAVPQAVDESKFKLHYRNLLNPAQYEAVCALEGPYLIIAGAGTGKTRTLVHRVARLIECGVDPSAVLLLTFTRKAAREMMNRAALLLDNRCSTISGGTFHSFANLTLRRNARAAGLDPSFTILDQGDSEDVINLIRSQSGLVGKEKRFPNKQTLNKIFSLAVNKSLAPEKIVEEEYPHFLPDLDRILQIGTMFRSYKEKNNLLDYDDLLLHLKRFVLELSPAARNVLSKIQYIMVDEYQDTNRLQAEVVQGLTQLRQNIMVVGDDAQSIYSFRGANFKNIMDFPSLFPGTRLIVLEENYRSTQEILNFANTIHDGAAEKYEKQLYSRKAGGALPNIVAAVNDNLQSKFIVEKILDLREEGVGLNDIAVLFRSSYHSFDLEIELAKANIPFVKFGGMKFVETAHVKDVLAFLRIALNPKDLVSWYRVLLLHEGIGPKNAQKILDALSTGKLSIHADPERQAEYKMPEKLYPLFVLLFRLQTQKHSPTEQTEMVLDYYLPIFKEKYDDFNKRKKDLDIFLNITANYDKPEALISDMAIEPPLDSVVGIGEEDKQEEYITLSTIHSAKGLEWHSVFIIHAVDGFFPMSRSAGDIESLEEERRLMYVASTRAKQNLFVTYPMNLFDREHGTTLSKPSRFLNSITPKHAEGWLLE